MGIHRAWHISLGQANSGQVTTARLKVGGQEVVTRTLKETALETDAASSVQYHRKRAGRIHTPTFLASLCSVSCQRSPLGEPNWNPQGKGAHWCGPYRVCHPRNKAEWMWGRKIYVQAVIQ